jgi:hypothetical protein
VSGLLSEEKNMAPFQKEVLEKKIIFLWQNAIKSSKNIKQTTSKPFKYLSTEKRAFFLNEEGINCLTSILQELKKDKDVDKKFSNTYLENAIKELIIELLPVNPKNIISQVRTKSTQLLSVLSQSEVDWIIMNPIENLKLDVKFLDVGPVRFSKSSRNFEKRVLLHQGKQMRKFLQEKVLPSYRNTVIAFAHVTAVDEERARELGTHAINEAIDILRFYRLNSNFRNVDLSRNNIGIAGQLHQGTSITLCLKGSKNARIVPHFEKIGFLFPYQIDATGLHAIRKDCFDILDHILKKGTNQTEFEKRILSGVSFCALSTEDEAITNSFVNSIVSLEAILLSGKETKAGNLAERVALIVGKNSSQRNWLFDQVIALYKIRSEIVHSGCTDVPLSSLRLLQLINYTCIIKLLKLSRKKKFSTVSDLIDWCRFKKFK